MPAFNGYRPFDYENSLNAMHAVGQNPFDVNNGFDINTGTYGTIKPQADSGPISPAELASINANSMATNAASRAQQPLMAANGTSLLTPAQQAGMSQQDQFTALQGNEDYGLGDSQSFHPTSGPTGLPGWSGSNHVSSDYQDLSDFARNSGAPGAQPNSFGFMPPPPPAPAPVASASYAPPAPVTGGNVSPTAQSVSGSAPFVPGPAQSVPPSPTSTATNMPYSNAAPMVSGVPEPSGNTWQSYLDTYGNTGAGNVLGTGAHTGQGAYGLVPGIPDPNSTANQAIAGNNANLSGNEQLGAGVNAFNLNQLHQQYESGLPNYGALTQQASTNIGNELHGVLPPDVVNQLEQSAAERGISSGSYDDPNSNAALLKSLGLTSLNLENQGQTDLTAAVKRTPTTALFNPQSMMTTPGQIQDAQVAANKLAAAPDPALAAAAAQQAALAGVKAGANLGGGGGVSSAPNIGGPLAGSTSTGSTFNPVSGGGGTSIPTGTLGGGTNLGGFNPSDYTDSSYLPPEFSGGQLPDEFAGYGGDYGSADEADWASLFGG
jgi:hypothetical protein